MKNVFSRQVIQKLIFCFTYLRESGEMYIYNIYVTVKNVKLILTSLTSK